MPEGLPDRQRVGYYVAMAQVGLEMVFPLGIGLALDRLFDWSPWATVAGAVFGFVGGLAHLVVLANRLNTPGRSKRSRGENDT
jgi:F0F1-type ATP synthase assembly protein I